MHYSPIKQALFTTLIVLSCLFGFMFSSSTAFAKFAYQPQQILTLPVAQSPDGMSCTTVSDDSLSCKVSNPNEGFAVVAAQDGVLAFNSGTSIGVSTFSNNLLIETIYSNLDSVSPLIGKTISRGEQLGTVAPSNNLRFILQVNGQGASSNGWWLYGTPSFAPLLGIYIGGFWDNTKSNGPNMDLGQFCVELHLGYVRAHWGETSWDNWHCIFADGSEGQILDINAAAKWAANKLGYCQFSLLRDGKTPFRDRLYSN